MSGCYLSHGRENGRDGGTPVPGEDAGPDAGPPACTLERIGEVVVRDPLTHSAQAPDAVWTGRGLAVAMMESGGDTSHPIVTMVEVSPDLAEVGEPRTIGEEAHSWGELDLASDGLTVCWNGDPGGTTRTLVRQVFEDGRLGPRRDHDADGESCLDLVASGDRALVAWRHHVTVSDDVVVETRAQLIAADGAPLGEPIVLVSAPYPGRSVDLFATPDAFFAAISPATGTVKVLEIGRDGRVTRERAIDASDARFAAVAASGDRVALLIASGPSDARSVHVLVLDRTLTPLGEARVISDGAPTTVAMSLAPAPDGWVALWSEGYPQSSGVTMLHLDHAGLAREPRVRAHRGTNSSYGGPSLARNGGDFYLAFSRAEPGASEGIAAQRWRCASGARDACAPVEIVEGDCDGEEQGAWRWTGTQCVFVSCPSACTGECDRLAPSLAACLSDHAQCAVSTCDGALAGSPIDRACADAATIRTGEPLRVTVTRAVECPCGASLQCAVYAEEPFVLRIEPALCTPPADCDCLPGTIETLNATCQLPPLSPGRWTVRSDGLEPLSIEVIEPWESAPPRTPTCSGD